MIERSRSEILSRTQRLILMGEWLERNEPILVSLIVNLQESVELHLDDEYTGIDAFLVEHFHQLSHALSALNQNLDDYKESLKSIPSDFQLKINYPWHCRSIKQPTVVLDEQQT